MSFRSEMVRGGMSTSEAVAANGSFETGVNLTGFAGQGARQVTAANTVVTTTVATTGDSLTLPKCEQGDWLVVCNYSASPVKIYPPSGWKIHNAAVDASYNIAANKTAMFTQITDPAKGGTQEFFAALSA